MGLGKTDNFIEMFRDDGKLTKKTVIVISSIIIICVFVVMFFLLKDDNYVKLIIGDEKTNEGFIKIYDISDDRNLYSQFTSLQFSIARKEKVSLKYALEMNIVSLDKILSKSNYYDSLNDGGSIIYYFRKGRSNFVNRDFEIICCDTLDGVKDVYIVEQFNVTNNICVKSKK